MKPEPRVELVHLPEMTVVGYEIRTSMAEERSAREIPAFWELFHREQRQEALPASTVPGLLLGLCHDEGADGSFRYVIGVMAADSASALDDQVRLVLPAARCARVTVQGAMSRAIPEGFRWFHREWLPATGLTAAAGVQLEWYDHRTCGEVPEVDLLIPVK
ncbi:MAG: GyrI-like domain-containing protein [bacterium]|jgi:AraC family transcriptional regulator|nr:GyrI-like domain-containing protein [bacterium]